MDPKLLLSDIFNRALADYFYLIDKGYPEKGSLKIVGDRYRLPTELRTLLYRGISSAEISKKRIARILLKPIPPLIIDGYNVLLTLMNYRLGRFVFISTDTLCRDAGSLFGKILSDIVLEDCILQLVTHLQLYSDFQIIIYLDAPVSNSQYHGELLLSMIKPDNPQIEVKVVQSADDSILQQTEGTIASSDSELIDNSNLPIIDIPFRMLREKYNTEFFSLNDKLAEVIHS